MILSLRTSVPYGAPPSRRLAGLSLVVLLHLALGWALVNGLARRVIDIVQAPVQVDLLKEHDRPPLPPPPPPLDVPEYVPPPSFVPPPEVRVQPPPAPAPVITTTVVPPPAAPVHLEPAPAVVPAPVAPAPPAPPRPPPDLSRPARIDVSQCSRPEYPPAARRAEASGTTRLRFRVDASGRVVAAEVLEHSGYSGAHRQLDRAAVDALSGCHFEPGRNRQGQPVGGYATVEYVWRIE